MVTWEILECFGKKLFSEAFAILGGCYLRSTCKKVEKLASVTMDVSVSPLPRSNLAIVCIKRKGDSPWVKDSVLRKRVKFLVTFSIAVTCHCRDQFNFKASKAPFVPFCCHSTTQQDSFIECS